MKQHGLNNRNRIVSLPCACASLRRAARIVSQRYDRKMRTSGLKGTQFTLLQALMIAGDISQGKLGEILGLDSTTLTRTLSLLRKKRWIQAKPGEDRRQVRLTLTVEGRRKYQSALPYWRSAQQELRAALGEAGWNLLMDTATRTAALLHEWDHPTRTK
jgi:DNA-binding MarR family transcriptional regulator